MQGIPCFAPFFDTGPDTDTDTDADAEVPAKGSAVSAEGSAVSAEGSAVSAEGSAVQAVLPSSAAVRPVPKAQTVPPMPTFCGVPTDVPVYVPGPKPIRAEVQHSALCDQGPRSQDLHVAVRV